VTVRRLNRYEVMQIQRLSSIENFVSERDNFIFNSFRNFKPVKRFQNRSDVLEFWSLDNNSNKSLLDVLETIYLKFRKTIVQRVTVVKLGVYDGGGNCFGGVKLKVGTDKAESTNVPQAATAAAAELLSQSNGQSGRIKPIGRWAKPAATRL